MESYKTAHEVAELSLRSTADVTNSPATRTRLRALRALRHGRGESWQSTAIRNLPQELHVIGAPAQPTRHRQTIARPNPNTSVLAFDLDPFLFL